MLDDLNHVVNALPPADGAFTGTVTSKAINMKNWGAACFIVACGTTNGGTATITLEACSDITGTATSPVEFFYQECLSGDTYGPIVKATSAGFTTGAADDKIYKIFVEDENLAASGYNYVRLKSVEQVVGATVGSVIVVLTDGRFESEIPDTVLV